MYPTLFSEPFRTEKGAESKMIRNDIIERKLMVAELELDGLKTHTTMRKEQCPIYDSPYDHKVRKALSEIRGARDILRIDTHSKQWTITTRSKQANRHGLWDFQYRKPFWQCGFCTAQERNPILMEVIAK